MPKDLEWCRLYVDINVFIYLLINFFNTVIHQVFVCLFGFYGISTFVGYLMPNPFLYKLTILFKIQFSISTQFNCQKCFYFKLFN